MATEAATFAELQAALKRENYAKAVDICNKIRSKTPDDADAVRIKCVALIRLGKFDKALELAVKYDSLLSTEKAYCLYRLKRDDEALAIMPQDIQGQSEATLHLAAQLNFRKGNYAICIQIYEHLLSIAHEGDDLMELQTNLLAAYASAGKSHELENRSFSTEDSFEVAFNKSFVAIQSGNWDAAEHELEQAERLCRQTFAMEGASAAEIENEVAIIRVQTAFVKQMKGDLDGALSDYRNVLKLKLHNQAVGVVASNNIVTIRNDRDLFDSFKRLKSIDSSVNDKLTAEQQEAILANRALLLCLMNKPEEARASIAVLKERFPVSKIASDLIVFLATKDQSPIVAIELLKNDLSLGGRLGLAHVYLVQGELTMAAECIRSIEELAHSPGTVATLVALYEAAGDDEAAQGVLDRALTHHQQLDFASDAAMKIREGDCAFKIHKKQYQNAADAYLDLIEGESAAPLDPDLRLRSLASLVIALSYCDTKSADVRCTMLPPVKECAVEPSELERLATRSNRLPSKLADAGEKKNERKRAAKTPERIARKRAKRREAFLTKLRSRDGYNPTIGLITPDPERWIPRKQRSHGKRGRRGRNRFVGAQGAGMGTEKDALKLDAAARAARKAEGGEDKRATAVVVSSQTSAVQRKAGKKKKRR